MVSIVDGDEKLYSEKMACVNCGVNIPTLEPRSFSFNSAFGACKRCVGLGTVAEVDPAKLIPDANLAWKKLTFLDEVDKTASTALRTALAGIIKKGNAKKLKGKEEVTPIPDSTPFHLLPPEIIDGFFNGISGKIPMQWGVSFVNAEWKGVIRYLGERLHNAPSEKIRTSLNELISPVNCPACDGKRLSPESLSVKIGGLGIADYTGLTIEDSEKKFDQVLLSEREEKIAGLILKEIRQRIKFLNAVGLGYLTLSRPSATLSGGEGQRIRLATQIGSQLRGVLYVLDEPSIGLHPRDNQKLIQTLQKLRDLGNTVLVVEHDEETIMQADYVIDLGPLAGSHGGEIIAFGTPAEIKKNKNSITGKYITGKLKIDIPKVRRSPNGKNLVIKGARANNLKNIEVTFPLGILTVVTGVSGSGKSTLVDDILYRALMREIYGSLREPAKHDSIEGLKLVDKIIEIDQTPIGRTPRSNPATYTALFTPLRDLYAMLPESRERGYKAGRFSFNVKGGRCEACEGGGLKRIEMNFLPDVYVMCDVCRGHRYNRETLAVKYKGYSIAELLDTTIEDALPILENIPQIKQKLQTLLDVGLGYIKLGQSATTLSGGEAQRIKLAKELSKRATGKTVYILDEPTTGLHFADVHKLLEVLQRLVDTGNTVIVIEHNLDVIKSADHVIDLGPEGGSGGGKVVAVGTPEDIAKEKKSHTGKALKSLLN